MIYYLMLAAIIFMVVHLLKVNSSAFLIAVGFFSCIVLFYKTHTAQETALFLIISPILLMMVKLLIQQVAKLGATIRSGYVHSCDLPQKEVLLLTHDKIIYGTHEKKDFLTWKELLETKK